MSIIQPPALSPFLLQTIERAEAMHGFTVANSGDSFVLDTTEKMLFVSLFSLVEEHHGAILYLLRTGMFDGSALALVRPVVDAAYRAHWIYACATPEIRERIRNGDEKCYPGLVNMAESVEKTIDAGGFFTQIAPYISALHGYTHGGLEQLGRRFQSDGNMAPSYSDEERAKAIRVTTDHYVALAISWCSIVIRGSDVGDSRAEAISNAYQKLYPNVGD